MRLARLLAFALALILAGCGAPPLTPAQVAERFFAQCSEKKFTDAYNSTTVAFRVEKSAKYFEARVRDLSFDKVKKFEWQEPQIKGDIAQRWGDITLPSDEKLTIVVSMHRDGKSWRIHEINRVDSRIKDDLFAVRPRSFDTAEASSKAFTEPVSMEPPTERLVRKMVEKTLSDFNEGIKAGDFSEFFNTVSDRWKFRGMTKREIEQDLANVANRITIPSLNTAFKSFIDAKVDISGITKAEMKLVEPARINSDGVLLAEGEFSTSPTRVIFRLEYFFEGGRWKLFGLSVDLKK
jgi:hypothetical protein